MKSQLIVASVWVAALVAALVPGVAALDSGGVYAWTRWATASALLFPVGIGLLGCRLPLGPRGYQAHLITVVFLLVALFASIQLVTLPGGLGSLLAGGSYSAWTQWNLPEVAQYEPLGDESAFPVSVAPILTKNAISYFVLFAASVWCGATLFHSRARILYLLAALSIAGAVHAMIGIWQVAMYPDYTFWKFPANNPFGVFVNRNNAAAFLNLALACSLGLVGWRVSIVTGYVFGGRDFSLSALLDVFSDRWAVLASIAGASCFAGILTCGSRGGLAGCAAGLALALGLFSSPRIAIKLLASGAFVSVLLVILLVRVDVTPRTLERFGAVAEGVSENILSDSRIPHWSDGLTAAGSYFPSGAGFGTYRFAYLPFQEQGSGSWFHNADNLWLEWLVEGGLVAVLAMLVIAGAVIYALLQLRATPDPINHGIAATGWYAVAAVAVSQFFDFGLLLVGISSGFGLILGLVVSRASIEGIPLQMWFQKKEDIMVLREAKMRSFLPEVVGAVLLMTLVIATFQLRDAAAADAISRRVDSALLLSDEGLNSLANQLRLQLERQPLDYQTPTDLAGVEMERARRAAINKLQMNLSEASPQQLREVQSLNSLWLLRGSLRRLGESSRGVAEPLSILADEAIAETEPFFQAARAAALTALARAPLSPEPRFVLLKTDASQPVDDAWNTLANQLLVLRKGGGVALEQLGVTASAIDQWELARKAWAQLLRQRPLQTEEYLAQVEVLGVPEYWKTVESSNIAMISLLQYEKAKPAGNPLAVQHAIDYLAQHLPESKYAKADLLATFGQSLIAVKERDQGIEYLKQAAEMIPSRYSYHEQVILALKRYQPREAFAYALTARQVLGSRNNELEELIDDLQDIIGKSSLEQDNLPGADVLDVESGESVR